MSRRSRFGEGGVGVEIILTLVYGVVAGGELSLIEDEVAAACREFAVSGHAVAVEDHRGDRLGDNIAAGVLSRDAIGIEGVGSSRVILEGVVCCCADDGPPAVAERFALDDIGVQAGFVP